MQQTLLTSVLKNETIDGYLLVKSAEQRSSKTGTKYLDMNLADVSGEINAKMWDPNAQPPKAGQVIRVRATMLEYNDKPQLRVDKFREINEMDPVDMTLLIPCAPYDPNDMLDFILNRMDAIADKELKALVLFLLEDAGDKLIYYPAGRRLHHAERSGLLHHTSTMLRAAEALCQVYPSLDADLLAAGVVLHDLCKLSEMDSDDMGVVSSYTLEGELLGHLVQGVSAIGAAGKTLGTRKELVLLLQHMILAHHDLPEYGSPKHPMFPEAEVLHILDRLDARLYEMNYALENLEPGTLTDRIWSLERKLYKREAPPKNDTQN